MLPTRRITFEAHLVSRRVSSANHSQDKLLRIEIELVSLLAPRLASSVVLR